MRDLIPITTIIGALSAPTISSVWAERRRTRDAKAVAEQAKITAQKVSDVKTALVETSDVSNAKLDLIHVLVNNQLSEAVERFEAATREIAELKTLLKSRGVRI